MYIFGKQEHFNNSCNRDCCISDANLAANRLANAIPFALLAKSTGCFIVQNKTGKHTHNSRTAITIETKLFMTLFI